MAVRKTPVMQQHAEAKSVHPDAIVFFRLGDFYEMFGDDAVVCSELLDLTLTSRNRGKPDEVPMAGVPHHAAHGYIGRLLALGRKVAICEQMADPATTKGIVPREVVRVITPGTVTHGEHLEENENSWLAAIEVTRGELGVALYDLSTGELLAGSVADGARLLAELGRAAPREILVGAADGALASSLLESVAQSTRRSPQLDAPLAAAEAERALGELSEQSRRLSPVARSAAARALRFVRSCNPRSESLPLRITRWEPSETLLIDPTAQVHLELVTAASGGREGSLLHAIDLTKSALGSRLLRRRLLAPSKDVALIRRRLDKVELFVIHSGLRSKLRDALAGVTDIERLSVRAAFDEATPRELGRLRDGLLAARQSAALLAGLGDPALLETLGLLEPVDTVDDLADELARALVERPPAVLKEDAVFNDEYDPQLTELRSLFKSGARHTIELETRLKTELGIPSLKVRYTRVFGWYVEVTRTHVARVPSEWRRKQTIAGGERYTLPELDDLAEKIAGAEDLYRARERELFDELLQRVKQASVRLYALAEKIADWDVAAALAELAHRHDYVRPLVDESAELEIADGRHPVVERWVGDGRFVPNDVKLDARGERLWIVTGPNMAGKSTLLRQVALITLLAQMGSYVPAKRARVGVVDRVLSRVGASDNLARGESTFMVEMRETAEILLNASERSLVILDEIGRGTSTFDGLAIAWAVAEHLERVIRCRVLFATHYHELTALGEGSEHVANYSVSAREQGQDVVFLHRLVHGPASHSYGVAVARLAGLPRSVLQRAESLLQTFEAQEDAAPARRGAPHRAAPPSPQLSLFTAANAADEQALGALRDLDLDRMSPLEALTFLADLKKRLTR
jgi:DNA mismatch repair protein MutS